MDLLQRLLVLTLLAVATLGKSFAENTTTSNATTPVKYETPIAAIVAPCVIGGILLIAIVLTVVIIKVKGKRREEGTYNPSQQEQIGARTQINHGLKLPPEERLI